MSHHENYQSHTWEPELGDAIVNTNPGCKHKGSKGIVVDIVALPSDAGTTVTYYCTNSGPTWNKGQTLTKTLDQLSPSGASLTHGTSYHLGQGIGIDKPIYRPGSPEFFDLVYEMRQLHRGGAYTPRTTWEGEILASDLGEWGIYEGKRVPLDFPILIEGGEWHAPCSTCADYADLIEAKYKGKSVELGKPKHGGGGKAYVYVRDPKTGNVKKVSFGSSMPDAMGDSEAARKRRKSFGNRHNCADKTDRTQAGYWACRATKFFGRNIPGWW